MNGAQAERTGVLILRAWIEAGEAERLRVRVTQAVGPTNFPDTAAETIEDTCALVRHWLDGLLTQKGGDDRPTAVDGVSP
jgi:hypothetical protein